MYGGRAIDSFDRRILTVYMDEYLGDFLFWTFQKFYFFRNKDVAYKIPPHGHRDAYISQLMHWLLHFSDTTTKSSAFSIFIHSLILLFLPDEINNMPLSNTPEVLGLHSNAETGYYTQAVKEMWTHLIDLQPHTGMNWQLWIRVLSDHS